MVMISVTLKSQTMAQDIAEPSGHHRLDRDDLSTAATATEETPLLHSETASSQTLRDGSPGSSGRRVNGESREDGSPKIPSIGLARAICIIISMWALIFLQGWFSVTSLPLSRGR
jgi:hypothetical protein